MRHAISLSCVAALLASAAVAAPPPSEAERAAMLLRGTAEAWSGVLTYSDYQTGERTSLNLTRTVTLLPDGATLQAISAYDDGPAGIVDITSLQALESATGLWQSAAFRKGDGMETGSARLTLPAEPQDDTHWRIVKLEDGTDGDSPALIRETITRDGRRLSSLTEYDRKDDGAETFQFRNEEVLTLAD